VQEPAIIANGLSFGWYGYYTKVYGDPMRRIGQQTDVLGESPVWSVVDQALYWVDIRGSRVRRLAGDGVVTSWETPEIVGSVALGPSGLLILGLKSRIALFEPLTGGLKTIAAPEANIANHRFNDGRCDRRGRFWCGSMNDLTREPVGCLYRFSSHGAAIMRRYVRIPNGLCFSADGSRVFFADSVLREIYTCALDQAGDLIGDWRSFAKIEPPAIPDGATIDAEGFVWVAVYDGWRVIRLTPEGAVDRVLDLPVQKPTSCTFGGARLDTLFVTTASEGLTPEALHDQPLAGALLAIETGASGVPEPVFRQ
jgi:sugar lactone lactonase YvrE